MVGADSWMSAQGRADGRSPNRGGRPEAVRALTFPPARQRTRIVGAGTRQRLAGRGRGRSMPGRELLGARARARVRRQAGTRHCREETASVARARKAPGPEDSAGMVTKLLDTVRSAAVATPWQGCYD
jgi:hypothetical protein